MSQEIHNPPKTPLGLHLAAWALAVVSVVLPVLLLLIDQRVLSGARDRNYFLSYTYDGSGNESWALEPDIGFWDRWSVLAYTAPPEKMVLAPAAICVLLAAVHLAGGGRWPLHRGCRLLAVGSGALAALCAAAILVVNLVQLQVPEDDRRWYSSSSSLLDIAWPLSALGSAIVFAVVAGVVLLGPPAPRVEAVRAPEAEPLQPEPEPVTEQVAEPTPEPVVVEPPAALPRPTAEEYASYRRPVA